MVEPGLSGRLSDQLYERVRTAIAAGELVPGTRLVELELARRYGVSQAPVRDALKRLAAEGLVLQFPRRGSYVADISEEDARQAYRVRAVLEQFAATEVCRLGPPGLAELLAGDVEAMRAAARRDDVGGVVDGDVSFHRHVWEAAGNGLLARMWTVTEAGLRSFTAVSNKVYFGRLEEIAENHVPLVTALGGGVPEVAGILFREHVLEIWERIGAPIEG
ncbi:DNA-binding GntR family transcriptional regulator [Streptacidiphilus sp. MAP12-16]|uniref:GntR family transcriptional regulator n=1 Tax=Streptacidiphilus sp. MAP12-16 TaxID=3156300 RepID=UPI0035174CC6